MSKIGKKPIKLPENTKIELEDGQIFIEGQKGRLVKNLPPEISILKENNLVFVNFKGSKDKKLLWGTWQRLIQNMIEGVNQGFEKQLKIKGIGWRAKIEDENLILKVGFTHPVKILPPEGVNFSLEKDIIRVSGIDKEKVGFTAAKIRSVQPPEPYKGKGIRYIDEVVRIKAGKKAIAAEK